MHVVVMSGMFNKYELGYCLHGGLQEFTSRGGDCVFLCRYTKNTYRSFLFYVHVTVHRNKFLYNKTN